MGREVFGVVDVIHELEPVDLAPLLVVLNRPQVIHAVALVHLSPAADQSKEVCFVVVTPRGMLRGGRKKKKKGEGSRVRSAYVLGAGAHT